MLSEKLKNNITSSLKKIESGNFDYENICSLFINLRERLNVFGQLFPKMEYQLKNKHSFAFIQQRQTGSPDGSPKFFAVLKLKRRFYDFHFVTNQFESFRFVWMRVNR